MERKKLFVRVGIGVAGALLLVGIFAVANAVGDSNAMRRGIDEGFELRGTYQGDPGRDGIGTIAFQTLDGEPSWEASKAPGAHVKGAFKETVDPNIYVLEDESGNGVGWVHLRTPMPRGRERCTSATARSTWWRCARWIGCPVICATITNEIPDQMRFALAAADIRARSLPSARAFRFSTKRKPFHVRW